MISNTDSISCVYSTAHIRVKVYLGRRLRQQWPKWISIASSRLCVTSGRLLRNTLLTMMWFFRSPAGYSRKPTKPYRGGNVDSRKVICEVAPGGNGLGVNLQLCCRSANCVDAASKPSLRNSRRSIGVGTAFHQRLCLQNCTQADRARLVTRL